MNSVGGYQQKAGAGVRGGHIQTAPAQFQVGAVGFGPSIEEDDEEISLTTKGYRRVCDGMARSIVRLEAENEELRAEVALLREERAIILRDATKQALKVGAVKSHWIAAYQERDQWRERAERLAGQMQRLADCDWRITLPDRMDAVRDIAREALKQFAAVIEGGTAYAGPSDLSRRTNLECAQ